MTALYRSVRRHRIVLATVAFLGYSAVMLRLDGRMRAAGGPGIIPFEFALIALALGYATYPAPTGRTGR